MAVYKRTYQPYSGAYTPQWSRFLIVSRYASANLSRSRAASGFFVLCLVPFVVAALAIYLSHSATVLSMFKAGGNHTAFNIDNQFFKNFLSFQVGLCFMLTAFVGPGLVSGDLANNALVLYFCRPLSRTEYVLGKFTVMAKVLSYLTWIPGLLLFAIEASQSGWRWLWDNLYIAGAVLVGSWLLIVVLSLLALALSAWVKWKPVAGALVLGVIFLGAGFGDAINGVMRTSIGDVLNVPRLLKAVWDWLFRIEPTGEVSPLYAFIALLAFAGACLYLLSRKLRAYEVVR